MIIECPSCNSRYRIREDKLPAQGGNIKCPNCAHVFFVPRGDATSTQEGTPATATGETVGVVAETPAVAPAPAPARAVPSAPDTGDDDARSEQRWKLRNSVGLVYDFPGLEELRRWLKGRDSFDGLTVSVDNGNTWEDIGAFTELEGVQPTGRMQPVPVPAAVRSAGVATNSGSFSGAGAVTKDDIRREAQARVEAARNQRVSQSLDAQSATSEYKLIKPAASPEEERTGRLLLALALVILPVVALIALHSLEIIDLSEYGILPERQEVVVEETVTPSRADEAEAPRQIVEMTTEQAANLLITQASSAVSRGDTPQAIEFLERALELDSEDTELHCQLAGLYEEVERTEDAELSRQRCAGDESEPEEAVEDPAAQDPPAAAGTAEEAGSGDDAPSADAPSDEPPVEP